MKYCEFLIKIAEYLNFFLIFKSSNSKPNIYSKIYLKRPLKIDKAKILMINDSLTSQLLFMFQCNEHVEMNKFLCSLACTWMTIILYH